jgi:glycogen operon protein
VEGETDDVHVLATRGRQARAMLTTLLVSRGVPMLLGGDELGRTQGGNNNAYCQDNETSWLDWRAADEDLCGFVARLLALRGAHPALRGDADAPQGAPITWLRPDGTAMLEGDWEPGALRGVALRATRRLEDATDDVVVCVNGHTEVVGFAMPADVSAWDEALSSFDPTQRGARHRGGERVAVASRSVLVLVADAADG